MILFTDDLGWTGQGSTIVENPDTVEGQSIDTLLPELLAHKGKFFFVIRSQAVAQELASLLETPVKVSQQTFPNFRPGDLVVQVLAGKLVTVTTIRTGT